jgi:hypothetical protein
VSAVSRHARSIELLGVPTVAVAGRNIVGYALGYDFKYLNGMPIRFVSVPHPIAGLPKAVHRQYVEGKDLLSGEPLMDSVIKGLTASLTENEQLADPSPEAEQEPRLLAPDAAENLQRRFKEREWTDYAPVVLPTEKQVTEMLTGTSHARDEVVKVINNNGGARELTVEKVAVYGVMAGAQPNYLPLLLALAKQAPYGNSTTSMANMIVVNGPVRKQLGMNAGTNAMGPYNEANAVIGRAFTLMSKAAGDLRNEVSAWESLGNNLQYNNLTIAENEEELPEGWQPLHVQRGYKPEDSVVTVGVGWSYISSMGSVQHLYPAQYLIRDYMKALSAVGSAATIMMDPTVAVLLKDVQGFQTKDQLSQWLAENAEKTVASYWGNAVVASTYAIMGLQGLEPYASWQKLPRDSLIKPFNNPGAISIVAVGGRVQSTWFATDFRLGRGVLVDDWR